MTCNPIHGILSSIGLIPRISNSPGQTVPNLETNLLNIQKTAEAPYFESQRTSLIMASASRKEILSKVYKIIPPLLGLHQAFIDPTNAY